MDEWINRTCCCVSPYAEDCTAARYNETIEEVRYNGDQCECSCHEQFQSDEDDDDYQDEVA
jgi:hypothetical protein